MNSYDILIQKNIKILWIVCELNMFKKLLWIVQELIQNLGHIKTR